MSQSDNLATEPERRIGLVLRGGARGAYQVGILKAIAELFPTQSPFQIIVGASVGAINGAVVGCHAGNFKEGASSLDNLWSQIHTSNVYRTDLSSVTASALRWLFSLTLGGHGVANPKSFLDNEPLARLLNRELNLSLLADAIEKNELRALGVTASSYSRGMAITFIEGRSDIAEWQRARRSGVRCHR
jgi:NTE family protein